MTCAPIEVAPQPGNYFAECLAATGPAGEVLVPYLDRLAMTVDNYFEVDRATLDESGDELDKGLLERLSDAPDPEGGELSRAQRKLCTIFSTIQNTLQNDPSLYENDSINWLAAGTSLLDEAERSLSTQTEIRGDDCLRAAVICALFSEAEEDRLDFIQEVYSRGLESDMYRACPAVNVTVIEELPQGPETDRTRAFIRLAVVGFTFAVPADTVANYTRYLAAIQEEEAIQGRPRRCQDAVTEAYAADTVDDDLLEVASKHSTAEPDKRGWYIDPHKVERFALQKLLITEQRDALFPDGVVGGSPFARVLEALRTASSNGSPDLLQNLARDAGSAIRTLAKPVVERFRAPKGQAEIEPLTWRQQAGIRFKYIADQTNHFGYLAQFVDRSHAPPTVFAVGREISSLSEQGAAVSARTRFLLSHVLQAGLATKRDSGEALTAEALHALALRGRRETRGLATLNIADFNAGGPVLTPPEWDDLGSGETPIARNEHGSHELTMPVKGKDLRGRAPVQPGATVTCPALGEGKGEFDDGVADYIDALLVGIIDEAYGRGLLDLNNYAPSEPQSASV